MGDRINNMGKMMSNPQQRNIYLLGAGAVIITLGIGFFIASKNKNDQVVSGAQIENVPGTVKAVPGASTNPDYVDAVKKTNEKEANKAIQNGSSFVPTVTSPSVNSSSNLDEISRKQQQEADEKAKKEAERKKAEEEDKARMEEETKRQQALLDAQKAAQLQPVQVQQVQVQPVAQVIPQKPKKYTDDDYMLIASLNNNWKIKSPSSEYDFSKGKNSGNSSAGALTSTNATNTTGSGYNVAVTPISKAGTIYNAIIETAVNSDEESPVLARIVSGPLKGTRLIGTFKNLGEKVAIVFTTANIPSYDKTVKINAYAIDTNSSRTAIADDVDHHYFLRYGVLLATSFVSGYSQALAQSGATTTTSLTGTTTTNPTYSSSQLNKVGLGQVGQQISSDVKQQFNNLRPTIYVNSGTAVGILLMDDLTVK